MKGQKGFSLVELMVVLAVLAILATVSVQLYERQTIKSRRTEARVALNEIALAQERHFTINGTYGESGDLGAAYTDALGKMTDRDGSAGPDFYTVAVVANTTSYTVTATIRGAQLDADCTSFTINQLGVKTATGATTAVCW